MSEPAPAAPELETPVLLVAMPQVLDPFFHKSVVLLIHHQEEGSFGFIVNRPTGIKVSEILAGLEISSEEIDDGAAFFGGPVQPQLGTVIYHSSAEDPLRDESATEIYPGTAMTQQIGDLEHLVQASPESFRLFLGYAGWGEGQLVEEILRNDWLMAPVDDTLVFAQDLDHVWDRALASVGIDPSALPSWTGGDEGAAN